MDARLKQKLELIEQHMKKLFHVEHQFLLLDGNKKSLLASLILNSNGKSHAEKESHALASEDWQNFIKGHALKEAEYNLAKRKHDLLMKAFDAEYSTMKIESQAIRRQV